jgi:hypothetical protein
VQEYPRRAGASRVCEINQLNRHIKAASLPVLCEIFSNGQRFFLDEHLKSALWWASFEINVVSARELLKKKFQGEKDTWKP